MMVFGSCKVAGVKEVYKVGGVQAVAAVAFGTESILSVVRLLDLVIPMLQQQKIIVRSVGCGSPAGLARL